MWSDLCKKHTNDRKKQKSSKFTVQKRNRKKGSVSFKSLTKEVNLTKNQISRKLLKKIIKLCNEKWENYKLLKPFIVEFVIRSLLGRTDKF